MEDDRVQVTARARRSVAGTVGSFANRISGGVYDGVENLTGGRRDGEYFEGRKAEFGRALVAPPVSAFDPSELSIVEVDVPEAGERLLVGTFPMWTAEGPSDLLLKVSCRWTDEEGWWCPEDAWLVLPGETDEVGQ